MRLIDVRRGLGAGLVMYQPHDTHVWKVGEIFALTHLYPSLKMVGVYNLFVVLL